MAPPRQTFLVIAIAFFLTIPSIASLPPSSLPNVPSFVKTSMGDTTFKTQEFIHNVIEKKLANSAQMDHFHKDCLETCKNVYEDAIDTMKKVTQDVEQENFTKANLDLSAIYSFFSTCSDCVVETNEKDDPAFENFKKLAQGIVSDCLAKVPKKN